jgi:hypothetical protein
VRRFHQPLHPARHRRHAAVDWDAVITPLDSGRLTASGGEQRIIRIAASLAAGHPVSLRDAVPSLDQHSLQLAVTAIRRAAGQHP